MNRRRSWRTSVAVEHQGREPLGAEAGDPEAEVFVRVTLLGRRSPTSRTSARSICSSRRSFGANRACCSFSCFRAGCRYMLPFPRASPQAGSRTAPARSAPGTSASGAPKEFVAPGPNLLRRPSHLPTASGGARFASDYSVSTQSQCPRIGENPRPHWILPRPAPIAFTRGLDKSKATRTGKFT